MTSEEYFADLDKRVRRLERAVVAMYYCLKNNEFHPQYYDNNFQDDIQAIEESSKE